ncbi:G-type lectin S-receptor-like serine/threonine-protein kinase LECRK4 [Malania oleifera]|uniref:G-type lectin S-receptor-like serine/threonine-protein kinase LECRK4 n=1 Tax=Malania oleifera TaxID=397392 RepID=UPI0025ADE5A7|nr:G-type lectin S-receptor-like serine/threonine-protein kinase LECRK4 [Malania oleifera]
MPLPMAPSLPLQAVLFLLLLLPCFATAQANGTVTIGSSLTATEEASVWQSRSGNFAFGFRQLDDNEDIFLLSIWFDKIPEKTVVWFARKEDYVPSPRGSKVELTSDRGLVLTGPQGENLWNSDPIITRVLRGVMNDTGNFVLEDGSSERLWESFKHPTDTLLPGQAMERDDRLYSRKTETNFSQGRFRLRLGSDDGDLALATLNVPTESVNEPYYLSGTKDEQNSSNSGNRVVFNESGYLFILRRNGGSFDLTTGQVPSSRDFYHRATLNFDGVFTQFYRPMASNTGNQSWTALWSIPDNICMNSQVSAGSGACGYNRICSLGIDQRPTCACPRGFSVTDPEDEYRGCKPDFMEGCIEGASSAENLYSMDTITDIDWPTSDYELLSPYNEQQCKESCLQDCMCAVVILRDNRCWKKKLPLSNGRSNRSVNGKAFIKFKKENSPTQNPQPSAPNRKNQNGLILAISVLLGSSVLINFVLMGAIFLGFFFIYHKKVTRTPQSDSGIEKTLHNFTYKELVDGTDGFKEELGRGAFGIVYRGVVELGSSTLVAVKKLDRVVQERDKEFKTEVNIIGQTHHKNLVRLIGFCDEGLYRLLVYEFMSNGTLASSLFGELKLTWHQRTQIACGIARGLVYLHEECSTQIIHCDIKPQNILLDDWYNARISDFGLAKLLYVDQNQTYTAIRGTKGYVAPEWFRNMPITVKVDVYSFGVLLLEIICCRRSVDMEIGGEERAILTDWAYDCYSEGTLEALVENDEAAINDRRMLERLVMVSIWCIQEDPSLRPTMKRVLLMLEGIVEAPSPPCPFPYSYKN